MFSLLELVLALRASCPTFARRIGGSLEFTQENERQASTALPYAWVVPLMFNGLDVDEAAGYQSREALVGIVVAVTSEGHGKSGSGKAGASVATSFNALIAELEDAILRWVPESFHLDGFPTFVRFTPIAASPGDSRAWGLIEYSFPFKFVHPAYRGRPALEEEAFRQLHPNLGPAFIQEIIIKYAVPEDELNHASDGPYTFFIPVPPASPAETAAFDAASGKLNVTDAVQQVIADIRTPQEALGDVIHESTVPTDSELEFTGHGPEVTER